MRRAFDSSAIIHAWDEYPLEQFPGLWTWIEKEVGAGRIVAPEVVREEVAGNAKDCGDWLRDAGIGLLSVTDSILLEAARLAKMLGIESDDYGSGVGENDLIIIATVKTHGLELVTNEAEQLVLPKNLKNCKIPAVCRLDGGQVSCLTFIQYLKTSKAVF